MSLHIASKLEKTKFVENNVLPGYQFSWTVDIRNAIWLGKEFNQNMELKGISAVILAGIFLVIVHCNCILIGYGAQFQTCVRNIVLLFVSVYKPVLDCLNIISFKFCLCWLIISCWE